ncbi:MAG: hypothetical protein ACOY0T_34530 [Myxococcota bacterium]
MPDSSDPIRLAASTSEDEKMLSELFRAGQRDFPSSAQLDALALRLGPVLEAPVVPTGRAPLSKLTKLGMGIAALGALVGGVVYWSSRTRAPEAPPVKPSANIAVQNEAPSVSPPSVEQSAPPASAESEPAPANPPEANSAPKPSREKPSEATLLEQARRSLASNPAQALALTRRHQALYPRGVLAQEREVIAIEALRRLGNSKQASERADSFQREYPDSAHRRNVEKGLNK